MGAAILVHYCATRNIFFASDNHTTVLTDRPLLTIDYTPVPEPTGFSMALGALSAWFSLSVDAGVEISVGCPS